MPFAGVLGNLLKKRSENNANRVEFEHHSLPFHLCLRDIPPFPSFPPKYHYSYTGTRRPLEPKEEGEEEENQQLTEQDDDQDQERDGSVYDSMASADWTQSIEQLNTPKKDATPFNFDGADAKDEQGTKEGINENDQGNENGAEKIETTYGALYAGISIFFLGVVFSFTGHGERGFKTVWLLVVGPILCLVGFVLVVGKIILCHQPKVSCLPCCCCSNIKSLKNSQVGQLDEARAPSLTEMEKGVTNHVNHTGMSPKLFSPRIILLQNESNMGKKTAVSKLRNEIPNYIGNSSEEEIRGHGERTYIQNYNSTSQYPGRTNEIPLNPKHLPHHNNYNYHHDF